MNARNASGNTPLHVCAVNNTDASCIRQLLFRGAQKDALNYANQTPYQVAVIAGNMELAEVIKNYQPEEVGELWTSHEMSKIIKLADFAMRKGGREGRGTRGREDPGAGNSLGEAWCCKNKRQTLTIFFLSFPSPSRPPFLRSCFSLRTLFRRSRRPLLAQRW